MPIQSAHATPHGIFSGRSVSNSEQTVPLTTAYSIDKESGPSVVFEKLAWMKGHRFSRCVPGEIRYLLLLRRPGPAMGFPPPC